MSTSAIVVFLGVDDRSLALSAGEKHTKHAILLQVKDEGRVCSVNRIAVRNY